MAKAFEQITNKIHSCLEINSMLGPCFQDVPEELIQEGFDRALEKIQTDVTLTQNLEFIRLVQKMRENPYEIQSYFEKINMRALVMAKKLKGLYRSKQAQSKALAKLRLEQENSEQNFQKVEQVELAQRKKGGKKVSRKNHQIKK